MVVASELFVNSCSRSMWFLRHSFSLFVRSRNGHSPKCIMGRNGGTQKIIQGTEGSLAKSHHGANSSHQNGEGEQDPTRYMNTAVSRLVSLSVFLFSVHDAVDHCRSGCCSSFTVRQVPAPPNISVV